MRVTAGYGDSATWAPCTGHPNDPRTDFESEEEALMAFAERQCVEDEITLFEAYYFNDSNLIPEQYIDERLEEVDEKDAMFFLFPNASGILYEMLLDWMQALKNKNTKQAENKIMDILFAYGQEKIVQFTEETYRHDMSKMLENFFYFDKEKARKAAYKLFPDAAKEAAIVDIFCDAQELHDRIMDKWTHGGREDFLEGCWDE